MLINDAATREQHDAVRNKVGWYCWTHFLLEVTGADAPTFLDEIFVSPIAKMKVGRAKYTTMLDEEGIIIDDVIVYRIEEDKFWVSTLHMHILHPWLLAHKGKHLVQFEEITSNTEMYAVQGPNSRDLLNSFLEEKVDDQKFFTIRDNKIDDVPVKVARSGYSGELGFEVYISPDAVEVLISKLKAHGKEFDAMEVTEFQVKVWSLATEKGYNLMSDLRKTNPFEVGFEGSIDWSKEFIGKAAVEKVREEGPKRQLLGFIVDDETIHLEAMNRGSFGAIVKFDNQVIGRVTKYNYSYTLDKSIGFALVDAKKVKAGDRVEICGHGATLSDRTWYDPESKRPLGRN